MKKIIIPISITVFLLTVSAYLYAGQDILPDSDNIDINYLVKVLIFIVISITGTIISMSVRRAFKIYDENVREIKEDRKITHDALEKLNKVLDTMVSDARIHKEEDKNTVREISILLKAVEKLGNWISSHEMHHLQCANCTVVRDAIMKK